MDKKYIIPIILFLIGMVIVIIGALFKLLHWPFSSFLLIIGMLSQATALIILIYNLIKYSKQ